MKNKVFSHLFYEINKDEVYCWDCKGVQKKDSTLHITRIQKTLMGEEVKVDKKY